MGAASLHVQTPPAETVGRYAASELAGALPLNPAYAAFTMSELEALAQSAGESLRDALFTVGDAALAYIKDAESPSDRARLLEALAQAAGLGRDEVWLALRVARAFPWDERQQYAGQPKSWFVALTDRTGLSGDTPEERAARRREYAERCADLTVRDTYALLDAELRAPTRGELLDPYDTEPFPSKRPEIQGPGHSDHFQTDAESVVPLLPYLQPEWKLWECAWGRGQLYGALESAGHRVIGSDAQDGRDFLEWEPAETWDCVVTNPPYTLKDEFLARAYELGKPFAFLLPLSALEGQKRQRLYKRHGVQLLVLSARPKFTTPNGSVGGAWFNCAWFCWGLDLPSQITFCIGDDDE